MHFIPPLQSTTKFQYVCIFSRYTEVKQKNGLLILPPAMKKIPFSVLFETVIHQTPLLYSYLAIQIENKKLQDPNETIGASHQAYPLNSL